jgi:hypothetical protein
MFPFQPGSRVYTVTIDRICGLSLDPYTQVPWISSLGLSWLRPNTNSGELYPIEAHGGSVQPS